MKKSVVIVILIVLAQWWFTAPTITVPTNNTTFNYIVKNTATNDKAGLLPILVALHGNGDSTEHFYQTALKNLSEPMIIILLEAPIVGGRGKVWPYTDEEFIQYGNAINEAVELLATKYTIKQKPILLGFSGGAAMANYQAVKHGKSYSYIFSISGRLSENMLGDNTSNIGANVYVYHGKNDKVISVDDGRNAVKLLKSKGIKVNYTEFDGGHLGIFKEMNAEIIKSVESKILRMN